MTAAPSRAFASVSATCHVTAGVFAGSAAVDLGLVHPQDLGTALLDPGLTVADRLAVGQDERVRQRERRDLGLVVVRDVTGLERATQRVAVRVGSEVRGRRRRSRPLPRRRCRPLRGRLLPTERQALKRPPLLPPRTEPYAFAPHFRCAEETDERFSGRAEKRPQHVQRLRLVLPADVVAGARDVHDLSFPQPARPLPRSAS